MGVAGREGVVVLGRREVHDARGAVHDFGAHTPGV